jgi:hypothetical protein
MLLLAQPLHIGSDEMGFVRSKRKYYKYEGGTEPNATVVGSFGTVLNGVASGFSSANYVKTNPAQFTSVTPTASSWEMVFKFTYKKGTEYQNIWVQGTAYSSKLNISANGYIELSVSNSSSSTNIGTITGVTALVSGNTYWAKGKFTGSAYEVYLSTNGADYNLEGSLTSSTKITNRGTNAIGVNIGNGTNYKPFLGSIDLSQSYININGERWWSGDTYTIVGSWIDKGVVSGFSDSNYLIIDNSFAPANNDTWERVFKITTGSDVTNDQSIVGVNTDKKGFLLRINKSKFDVFISSGSSWDIASQKAGSYTVLPNTTYWVKAEFTGSAYNIYYSLNGVDYIFDFAISSSIQISAVNIRIGGTNASDQYWKGSIDLTQSYIKINGKMWWYGTKPIQATIDDYDYYEYESLKNYILTRKKRNYYKYQDFVQPVLTSNGTMSADSFAVNQTSVLNSVDGDGAWKAFDGLGSTTRWHSGNGLPQALAWYNPNPLKITNVKVTNRSKDGSYPNAYQLQYSDDKLTWVITNSGNGTSGDGVSWNIAVTESNAHKYWRLYITSASGSNNTYVAIGEIQITAQEVTAGTPDDYDYWEWSDTKRYLFARKKKNYYKYQDWTQPVLTANGTMGGDSFACDQSSYNNTGNEAYHIFNNDNKSWQSKAYDTNPQWLTFYNPKPLKLEKIKIYNFTGETVYYPKGMYIQGSNDNSTWETLYTYTGTSYVAEITCEVSSDKAYKYHRIYIYDRAYFNSENCFAIIVDVEITAQEAIGIYVDNGNIYKDWTQPINPSGISATSGWTDPTKAFDGDSSTYTECGTVTDYIEWDLGTDILLSSVTATGYWVSAVARACNMIIKSVDSYGNETTLGVTTGSADTTTYSLTTSFSETVVNKLRFYLTTNHLNTEPSTQYPTRIREINLTAREFVKTGDTIDDYDYIEYEGTKFY